MSSNRKRGVSGRVHSLIHWIKHDLPGRAGFVGVTAADDRRLVDGVRRRYRIGVLSIGFARRVAGPRQKPILHCNEARRSR